MAPHSSYTPRKRIRQPLPVYPGPAHPEKLDAPNPPVREFPSVPPFADDGPPPAAETPEERAARDAWLEATAERFAVQDAAVQDAGAQDAARTDAEQWRGWRTLAFRTVCRAGKLPVDLLLRLTPDGCYDIARRTAGVTTLLHGGYVDRTTAECAFHTHAKEELP